MKTLQQHLVQYALYHRDQRNIWTHFIGIPLIVIAVMGLCYVPLFTVEPFGLITITHLLVLAVSLFYLRLSVKYGVVMLCFFALCAVALQPLLALDGMQTTWASLAVFVVGWVFQFVGHYYEGRKPAFVDDLIGLAVGPLFVVAEWGFLIGLDRPLREHIEQQAGPVRRV